jgi:hypothetical protein
MVGKGDHFIWFLSDRNYPQVWGTRPLSEPVAPNGAGSAKVWRPCTPARAAGLTDRVWSLREVLLFRVPPWPQPQTV